MTLPVKNAKLTNGQTDNSDFKGPSAGQGSRSEILEAKKIVQLPP